MENNKMKNLSNNNIKYYIQECLGVKYIKYYLCTKSVWILIVFIILPLWLSLFLIFYSYELVNHIEKELYTNNNYEMFENVNCDTFNHNIRSKSNVGSNIIINNDNIENVTMNIISTMMNHNYFNCSHESLPLYFCLISWNIISHNCTNKKSIKQCLSIYPFELMIPHLKFLSKKFNNVYNFNINFITKTFFCTNFQELSMNNAVLKKPLIYVEIVSNNYLEINCYYLWNNDSR